MGQLHRHNYQSGIRTEVAGISHRNGDGTSRRRIIKDCRQGEELILVRDPYHRIDPNAVRVLRKNGEQLGYLPAKLVRSGLATEMDQGQSLRCTISNIALRGSKVFGVDLELTRVDEAPSINLGVEPSGSNGNVATPAWKIITLLLALIAVFAAAVEISGGFR